MGADHTNQQVADRPSGGTGAAIGLPREAYGPEDRVSPAASDSEKIRTVLTAIVRISLNEEPLEKQLEQILDVIVSVPWLAIESKGAILLVEDTPDVLVMKAKKNLCSSLVTKCAKVPFGYCLCGRAASAGLVMFADCVDPRHDVCYEGMTEHGHYVVPIISRGKMAGVLNLYVAEGHVRDPREEEFLLAVADLLSGLLTHRLTQHHLQDALTKLHGVLGTIIQAMGTTLERRDPYTAGHQRRVADLSRAIAMELGLPADRVEAVRSAATIHDIGKIAVPAEILSKPGKLAAAEFELIKIHAKVGYDILKGIDFPWPIARFVLQHHERLDGSGYPAGLSGEDILLEARILGIADVVEAMATHRPYRAAIGIDGALAEISKNKGILYDPSAAEACLRLFAEKGFSFSV